MHPLNDLRRLLNRADAPVSATVLAVLSGGLMVTTAQGVRTVRIEATDITRYRQGDTVRIDGDTVRGRINVRQELFVL